MTKDQKISAILSQNGAFWAFSDDQFNAQKKGNVRYISLGAGLICPKDNAKKLSFELDQGLKEIKAQEKAEREARAKALKIEKLPKADQIENRKFLISEATARINNYADDLEICERLKETQHASGQDIPHAIDRLLSAINWRANDRPEVLDIYGENIAIIKELKEEIINLI